MVKAGLILGLFGGSQKYVDSKVGLKIGVYVVAFMGDYPSLEQYSRSW